MQDKLVKKEGDKDGSGGSGDCREHLRVDRCFECGKPDLVVKQHEGTVVCTWCGIVQQSSIV